MKVIGIKENYPSISEQSNLNVFLMADSSLAKSGKPWFLPEYAESFHYNTHIVFRIGRLGKNIAKRFASRYVDAVTIGASVHATGLPDGALSQAFDGAAMIGEFIPIDEINDINNIVGSLSVNGENATNLNTADMICKIDELIEYLSKYFTLKIGDIIYSGFGDNSTKLSIGQTLSGTINGNEVLNIKIK